MQSLCKGECDVDDRCKGYSFSDENPGNQKCEVYTTSTCPSGENIRTRKDDQQGEIKHRNHNTGSGCYIKATGAV